MPHKFLQRFLPTRTQVRANRWLSWLDRWFEHPNYWRMNRDSVSCGLAIGLFAGMIPGPFQMLGAALLAIPLKANLPVALATTFYTNPFTIVPIYLLAYAIGNRLLGGTHPEPHIAPFATWDWTDLIASSRELLDWTLSLGKPLAVGLVALALTLAVAGYFAVQIGWRIYAKVHKGSGPN
jgi:uncharacterized protein (DUF2062 family)